MLSERWIPGVSKHMTGRAWLAVAVLFTAAGCAAPQAVEAPDATPVEHTLESDPTRVTIEQRRAHALRGFGGDVVLRIRDITGGQTILSIHDKQAERLVDPVSVERGDVVSFSLGADRYFVQLVELKNFLFGGDFAVFTVGTLEPSPLPEPASEVENGTIELDG